MCVSEHLKNGYPGGGTTLSRATAFLLMFNILNSKYQNNSSPRQNKDTFLAFARIVQAFARIVKGRRSIPPAFLPPNSK
jgi:hypothetical protein